jgi:hypothetical protein
VCKSCARRFYFSFTFVLPKSHATAVERRRWPLLRLAVGGNSEPMSDEVREENLDRPALPRWNPLASRTLNLAFAGAVPVRPPTDLRVLSCVPRPLCPTMPGETLTSCWTTSGATRLRLARDRLAAAGTDRVAARNAAYNFIATPISNSTYGKHSACRQEHS